MLAYLLTFLLEISTRTHDKVWLLSEVHRLIAKMRAEAVPVSQRIPAWFEEMSLSELDDIITACWFLKMLTPIDDQILLELDVLGAALEFAGCQTRLGLHMRDALKEMGLSNPWVDDDFPTVP